MMYEDFKLILGKGQLIAIGALGLGIGVGVGISYIITTSNSSEETEDIFIFMISIIFSLVTRNLFCFDPLSQHNNDTPQRT
jgi:hypothetical protein